MGKGALSAGLRGVGVGFCLFVACLLGCGSAQAQTLPTCEVYGTVGVPFSANLAVSCANDSSITGCPLVHGTIPFAPGINTFAGCTISGTPVRACVFTGNVFQVGSTQYNLVINTVSVTLNLGTIRTSTELSRPYMMATFTIPPTTDNPNPTLLDDAAACGYQSFNWQQQILLLPGPSPYYANDYSQIPPQNVYSDRSLTASPFYPLYDPPSGGYTYGPGFNPFPFVYPAYPSPYFVNENGCTLGASTSLFCPPFPFIVSNNGATLSFVDDPADHLLPAGEFIAYETSLVGVDSMGHPSPPLLSWHWQSTYNGTAGSISISQTASIYPVNPGSGTGGVTITSINGIQLPPVVLPNQVATTASGLAYSRVTQTFNGTVTLNNISSSAISGPLQILFLGLPATVTLVECHRQPFWNAVSDGSCRRQPRARPVGHCQRAV